MLASTFDSDKRSSYYKVYAKYAKMGAKCEKQKVYSEVFCVTFFAFRAPFFTFRISRQGRQLRKNSKASYSLIAKYTIMGAKYETWKVHSNRRTSHHFLCVLCFFFGFLRHFTPGLAFMQKVEGFTRNSHEMRKVYSECFIFRDVFCKNSIPFEIQGDVF